MTQDEKDTPNRPPGTAATMRRTCTKKRQRPGPPFVAARLRREHETARCTGRAALVLVLLLAVTTGTCTCTSSTYYATAFAYTYPSSIRRRACDPNIGRTRHIIMRASQQRDKDEEDNAEPNPNSNSKSSGNSKSSRRGRKPWWAKLKSQKDKKKRREERQANNPNVNADDSSPDDEQGPVSKEEGNTNNLLENLDPYKAGQKLRRTLDTALTTLGTGLGSGTRASSATKGYYLDDRFMESSSSALYGAERNPLFDRMDADDLAPEVLVVGATGAVGRLVVRRLLLDGRFRVRVLVRDLYSRTLNILGTGVTYCQGDLGNVESLEYALTDVDKIVFCAGAPRPDEEDFRSLFEAYVQEIMASNADGQSDEEEEEDVDGIGAASTRRHLAEMEAEEWNRLESVLEVRSRLAEQVDAVGMANLIHAYQNVRYADYGTGQAAKRSLFKFDKRPDDFNLFAIDTDYDVGDEASDQQDTMSHDNVGGDDITEASAPKRRKRGGPRVQCDWIRNDFGNAVFVGSVPTGPAASSTLAGEAAVVSSRLSSRGDPENGLDLGRGFAGFVCRLCSDGGIYECFVRTADYERSGVEYVCEFGTGTKQPKKKQSRNKFVSVRMPFSQFKAVKNGEADTAAALFAGKDVRQIGFRFRGNRNKDTSPSMFKNINPQRNRRKFYLALSYIKVYRSPPEPEFVYLSDARIPPVVKNGMVRDDVRQITPALANEGNTATEKVGSPSAPAAESYRIFDEKEAKRVAENRMDRSSEETYFKYKGEKLLRDSGLNYCIVRVAGYNEEPTTSSSKLRYKTDNKEVSPVSRADVAQVCVNALLDPEASNVGFYLSKETSPKKQSFGDLESDLML